ncbi:MAG TPA: hypothetical protein PLI05_11245 [Methanotrichaceae archaeon]|nr:hypothetical protein [Methanotrichaceae archaeon]HQF17627.1 hypothetical protein [Methanotrichaceae archaeon]HQI92215.1 hypothetical protein [Methanotrichaceae archaeon]
MGASDIKSADELVKSAHSAVAAISEWGTRVDMLIRTGGKVTELESFLNSFKIFQVAAGASVALGLLDGGLQFYCVLAGIPSKEDMIYKTVTDNSSKLTSLSNQLQTLYDNLVIQMGVFEAKRAAHEASKFINDQTKSLNRYAEAKGRHEDTSTLEIELFGANNDKCENKLELLKTYASALAEAATAEGTTGQYNLMNGVYNVTHGNVVAVATYGTYLQTHANQALTLYGVFHSRIFDDKKKTVEEYYKIASRDAQPVLDCADSIATAVQKYTRQCYINWNDNISKFINENYTDKVSLATPELYPMACAVICTGLKANYPWSDWVVIINDGGHGFEHHCIYHTYSEIWAFWRSVFGIEKKPVEVTIGRVDADEKKNWNNIPGLREGVKNISHKWTDNLVGGSGGRFVAWDGKPFPAEGSAVKDATIGIWNAIYNPTNPAIGHLPQFVFLVWEDRHPASFTSNSERFNVEIGQLYAPSGFTGQPHYLNLYHAFVMV